MPSSYKTCPQCGLTLASEVTVCGRCGNRFVMGETPLAPPPPLPDVSVPYQPPVTAPLERKQKVIAVSLALGLGGLGAHGFYLGNPAMGSALAAMFLGGGAVALILFLMALAGGISMWATAIGLVPLLIAATIPMIQAARYGIATPDQFHQWYVVEKRWF